jgi:hypothetical protein
MAIIRMHNIVYEGKISRNARNVNEDWDLRIAKFSILKYHKYIYYQKHCSKTNEYDVLSLSDSCDNI